VPTCTHGPHTFALDTHPSAHAHTVQKVQICFHKHAHTITHTRTHAHTKTSIQAHKDTGGARAQCTPARHDERQLRVQAHSRDVVAVALQGLHTRLGLIVPDLDELVVSARDQVWPVAACARGTARRRRYSPGQYLATAAAWSKQCLGFQAQLSEADARTERPAFAHPWRTGKAPGPAATLGGDNAL